MKKSIINFVVLASLMSATVFTACESISQKKDNVDEKAAEVSQDLNEMKAASSEEWSQFKNETETRISDNEARIAALKVKMKNSGKTVDAMRAKRIETLEAQNRELRASLAAYEAEQSDWETFKNEFNHDMEELEKALNDLTSDNVN